MRSPRATRTKAAKKSAKFGKSRLCSGWVHSHRRLMFARARGSHLKELAMMKKLVALAFFAAFGLTSFSALAEEDHHHHYYHHHYVHHDHHDYHHDDHHM
jgi:hypothetical protein